MRRMLKRQKPWKQKYLHEATAERNLPMYACGGCHPRPPKKNGGKKGYPQAATQKERQVSTGRCGDILGHSSPPCPEAQLSAGWKAVPKGAGSNQELGTWGCCADEPQPRAPSSRWAAAPRNATLPASPMLIFPCLLVTGCSRLC